MTGKHPRYNLNTTRTEAQRDRERAVSEARQARHELLIDGPAPAVRSILREMDRYPDGSRREEWDEETPAPRAARQVLGYETEGEQ